VSQQTTTLRVVGPAVDSGIDVNAGDRIDVRAEGTASFGSRFLGLFPPMLDADGDNWITPSDYPAPWLRKNSLLVLIRGGLVRPGVAQASTFFQGGRDRSFVAPYAGRVLLQANDADPGDNTGGWQVTVTRTFAENVPPRLAVDHIEFVQAIQRADNTVPVVSGQQLTVRVFVTSQSPATIRDVTGLLVVRDPAGRTFDLSPWNVAGSTSTVAAVPPGSHNRNLASSSLNFVVPSISTPGPLGVTAHAWVEPAGRTGLDATASAMVGLVESRPMIIQPYLISVVADGLPAPPWSEARNALAGAIARMPISAPRLTIRPPVSLRWRSTVNTTDPFAYGLQVLRGWLSALWVPDLRPDVFRVGFFRLTNPRWSGAGARAPWSLTPCCVAGLTGGNPGFDNHNVAHEIAHTLGLLHVDACGAGAPFDTRLPRMTEEPGWNTDTRTVQPALTSETMAYCGAGWPSIAFREAVLGGT